MIQFETEQIAPVKYDVPSKVNHYFPCHMMFLLKSISIFPVI